MYTDSVITIIPARYASTRFPGKPLVDLLGKPIIQRVVEQAQQASTRVVVATDDERIYDCVRGFGGEVVMTGAHHRSGTERCIEAYQLIGRGEQILINLQGDEPFVRPEQIATLVRSLAENKTQIATLAELFAEDMPDRELINPNVVKIVCSSSGRALYFSRSVVPCLRGIERDFCRMHSYYRHIGLYGFRTEILSDLVQLPASPLEEAESLEQLRWLDAGYSIQVEQTTSATIGIDTPADLERAIRYMKDREVSR